MPTKFVGEVDNRAVGQLIDKISRSANGREKLYQIQQKLDEIEISTTQIKQRIWTLRQSTNYETKEIVWDLYQELKRMADD